jgi:hypothetical protein
MSKKSQIKAREEERQSRKEILIARKEAEQARQFKIAFGIVGGLILLVIVLGLINEFVISPNKSIASVGEEAISLSDFQERVKFERAQRIVLLENQLEAFSGDVGIIQQFAGEMIVSLTSQESESFGETVLNQMVDEILVKQAAAGRGITVTDADVDEAIGEGFSYYGGGLPTPQPTATETIVPTPSLTPIPTAVITEVLPTATSLPEPTTGPEATPFPTATAVSEEAFQEAYAEFWQPYQEIGAAEADYREAVRNQLYRERLMDALAEENGLSTKAEHANFFYIAVNDEAGAADIIEQIDADGYLAVWNKIRSQPFDPEAEVIAFASEVLQRTQDELSQNFGPDVANAAFELPVDEPSDVIAIEGQDGTQYLIIMVSGREMLDLSEEAMQAQKQEALAALLADLRAGNVVVNDFWRGRVPSTPILDAKFLAQPTATPPQALPPEGTPAP